MARHDDEDEDAFDERGLLKDGRTSRRSLMMKDRMSDVRHQSGPVCDAAGLERKAQAYAEMCDDLQNAWRRPSVAADHAITEANAWKPNNINDREVGRVHNTGDAKLDAYLDNVEDLKTAWARGRGRR